MSIKNINSITFIAGDYPSPSSMKFVFVKQLVDEIVNNGVKVDVIAPQSLTHTIIRHEKLLPVHAKVMTDKGMSYNVHRPYTISFGNSHLFKSISGWFGRRAVKGQLKKIKPEILYAHFWGCARQVCRYADKNGIPLFVATGESVVSFDERSHIFSRRSDKEVLKRTVNGVIAVSSENKRASVELGLTSPVKAEVIPNCVNIELFQKQDASELKKELGITDNDFVVCFVGSFIPRKGPDRVARAITNLKDSKVKSIFIGKPSPGYNLDFNCPGILYKGPLDHDLIPKYLNCSNVFVLPTENEGCCNAIVEALAVGIPVISSTGAFNDDILNEKNSIRVDADDVAALTEAIKTLRDTPELRKSMSEYSGARHNEYGIEGRAQKILHFISSRID